MQQTNGMRLEKLELSNFAQFKEKQKIEFSKDDRVTIILGDNGSGKTTLLKAMRAGLGLEKQDEEHRQPQLKCNFDPAVINNENQFLFFNDIENLINIQDIDFLKFVATSILPPCRLFKNFPNDFKAFKSEPCASQCKYLISILFVLPKKSSNLTTLVIIFFFT